MLKIHDLAGVIPALATPLTRDGGVDEAGVGRLVDHVLAGGVTGLLPLGSTGECSSLDEGSRRAVLAAVVKANAGRVPIVCGVAQTDPKSTRLHSSHTVISYAVFCLAKKQPGPLPSRRRPAAPETAHRQPAV